MLKQKPKKRRKRDTRYIGVGIFTAAFLISFGDALFLQHSLLANLWQLVDGIRLQSAVVLTSTVPTHAPTQPSDAAVGSSAETLQMPAMLAFEQGQYVVPQLSRTGDSLQPIALNGFQIARTEVTRRQWKMCADENRCSTAGFPADYFDQNKLSLPITSVTTDQTMAFIEWINTKRPGHEPIFRLPNEAEWVVAARGGGVDHSDFAWGRSFDATKIRSADMLIPVDFREPVNGLYGMSDNAAERVSGCWIKQLSDGNCFRNLGIVRGPILGSIDEQSASLAHRAGRAQNIRYQNIGFRLAQ